MFAGVAVMGKVQNAIVSVQFSSLLCAAVA